MPEPFSVSKILSFWAEMGVIYSSSLHFPLIYELDARKPSGFPTMSNTNRAVQPQREARGLKYRIQEEDGLYYPCREKTMALISFAFTAKLICTFVFHMQIPVFS